MKFAAALLLTAAFTLPAAAQPVTFATTSGRVTITPIYHAAAIINGPGARIIIDPAKPAKIEGLQPADLILITDIHGDHMDAADVTALSKPGTTVIAPAAVQQTITQAKVLANGDSIDWRGWKITAVPMYNILHKQPNGQLWHDKGRGNGYVLTFGHTSFYFAGDTEGTPEMRALKNIDIAFIPMNLPYTMTPQEAADAVKAFHPKVAIPYHYHGSDITEFQKALDGSGIEVRLLDWYPK